MQNILKAGTAIFLTLTCVLASFGQQNKKIIQIEPSRKPDANSVPATKPEKQPLPEKTQEDDEVLRVETELVSIPAVVFDRSGKPLTRLQAKNFQVFEDGKPQQIENFATTETPFEIVLLLDTSGSTRGELNLIQRAAEAFIKALRPGDKVAVVAFKNEKIDERKESVVDFLTNLTDDRAQLQSALEKIKTSNGTPFYEAMEQIADKVFASKPSPAQIGRRAIVALTDGVDSTSSIEFEDARIKIAEAGVACYFVQVNTEDFVEERVLGSCGDETALRFSQTQLRRYRKLLKPRPGRTRPELENFCDLGQFERLDISRKLYKIARFEMEQMAKNTAGKLFPAADLNDAKTAFAQVAQEIGTQYSLGYYSNNQRRDGTFRQIRVELRGLPTGAKVQAREGYYAQKN